MESAAVLEAGVAGALIVTGMLSLLALSAICCLMRSNCDSAGVVLAGAGGGCGVWAAEVVEDVCCGSASSHRRFLGRVAALSFTFALCEPLVTLPLAVACGPSLERDSIRTDDRSRQHRTCVKSSVLRMCVVVLTA